MSSEYNKGSHISEPPISIQARIRNLQVNSGLLPKTPDTSVATQKQQQSTWDTVTVPTRGRRDAVTPSLGSVEEIKKATKDVVASVDMEPTNNTLTAPKGPHDDLHSIQLPPEVFQLSDNVSDVFDLDETDNNTAVTRLHRDSITTATPIMFAPGELPKKNNIYIPSISAPAKPFECKDVSRVNPPSAVQSLLARSSVASGALAGVVVAPTSSTGTSATSVTSVVPLTAVPEVLSQMPANVDKFDKTSDHLNESVDLARDDDSDNDDDSDYETIMGDNTSFPSISNDTMTLSGQNLRPTTHSASLALSHAHTLAHPRTLTLTHAQEYANTHKSGHEHRFSTQTMPRQVRPQRGQTLNLETYTESPHYAATSRLRGDGTLDNDAEDAVFALDAVERVRADTVSANATADDFDISTVDMGSDVTQVMTAAQDLHNLAPSQPLEPATYAQGIQDRARPSRPRQQQVAGPYATLPSHSHSTAGYSNHAVGAALTATTGAVQHVLADPYHSQPQHVRLSAAVDGQAARGGGRRDSELSLDLVGGGASARAADGGDYNGGAVAGNVAVMESMAEEENSGGDFTITLDVASTVTRDRRMTSVSSRGSRLPVLTTAPSYAYTLAPSVADTAVSAGPTLHQRMLAPPQTVTQAPVAVTQPLSALPADKVDSYGANTHHTLPSLPTYQHTHIITAENPIILSALSSTTVPSTTNALNPAHAASLASARSRAVHAREVSSVTTTHANNFHTFEESRRQNPARENSPGNTSPPAPSESLLYTPPVHGPLPTSTSRASTSAKDVRMTRLGSSIAVQCEDTLLHVRVEENGATNTTAVTPSITLGLGANTGAADGLGKLIPLSKWHLHSQQPPAPMRTVRGGPSPLAAQHEANTAASNGSSTLSSAGVQEGSQEAGVARLRMFRALLLLEETGETSGNDKDDKSEKTVKHGGAGRDVVEGEMVTISMVVAALDKAISTLSNGGHQTGDTTDASAALQSTSHAAPHGISPSPFNSLRGKASLVPPQPVLHVAVAVDLPLPPVDVAELHARLCEGGKGCITGSVGHNSGSGGNAGDNSARKSFTGAVQSEGVYHTHVISHAPLNTLTCVSQLTYATSTSSPSPSPSPSPSTSTKTPACPLPLSSTLATPFPRIYTSTGRPTPYLFVTARHAFALSLTEDSLLHSDPPAVITPFEMLRSIETAALQYPAAPASISQTTATSASNSGIRGGVLASIPALNAFLIPFASPAATHTPSLTQSPTKPSQTASSPSALVLFKSLSNLPLPSLILDLAQHPAFAHLSPATPTAAAPHPAIPSLLAVAYTLPSTSASHNTTSPHSQPNSQSHTLPASLRTHPLAALCDSAPVLDNPHPSAAPAAPHAFIVLWDVFAAAPAQYFGPDTIAAVTPAAAAAAEDLPRGISVLTRPPRPTDSTTAITPPLASAPTAAPSAAWSSPLTSLRFSPSGLSLGWTAASSLHHLDLITHNLLSHPLGANLRHISDIEIVDSELTLTLALSPHVLASSEPLFETFTISPPLLYPWLLASNSGTRAVASLLDVLLAQRVPSLAGCPTCAMPFRLTHLQSAAQIVVATSAKDLLRKVQLVDMRSTLAFPSELQSFDSVLRGSSVQGTSSKLNASPFASIDALTTHSAATLASIPINGLGLGMTGLAYDPAHAVVYVSAAGNPEIHFLQFSREQDSGPSTQKLGLPSHITDNTLSTSIDQFSDARRTPRHSIATTLHRIPQTPFLTTSVGHSALATALLSHAQKHAQQEIPPSMSLEVEAVQHWFTSLLTKTEARYGVAATAAVKALMKTTSPTTSTATTTTVTASSTASDTSHIVSVTALTTSTLTRLNSHIHTAPHQALLLLTGADASVPRWPALLRLTSANTMVHPHKHALTSSRLCALGFTIGLSTLSRRGAVLSTQRGSVLPGQRAFSRRLGDESHDALRWLCGMYGLRGCAYPTVWPCLPAHSYTLALTRPGIGQESGRNPTEAVSRHVSPQISPLPSAAGIHPSVAPKTTTTASQSPASPSRGATAAGDIRALGDSSRVAATVATVDPSQRDGKAPSGQTPNGLGTPTTTTLPTLPVAKTAATASSASRNTTNEVTCPQCSHSFDPATCVRDFPCLLPPPSAAELQAADERARDDLLYMYGVTQAPSDFEMLQTMYEERLAAMQVALNLTKLELNRAEKETTALRAKNAALQREVVELREDRQEMMNVVKDDLAKRIRRIQKDKEREREKEKESYKEKGRGMWGIFSRKDDKSNISAKSPQPAPSSPVVFAMNPLAAHSALFATSPTAGMPPRSQQQPARSPEQPPRSPMLSATTSPPAELDLVRSMAVAGFFNTLPSKFKASALSPPSAAGNIAANSRNISTNSGNAISEDIPSPGTQPSAEALGGSPVHLPLPSPAAAAETLEIARIEPADVFGTLPRKRNTAKVEAQPVSSSDQAGADNSTVDEVKSGVNDGGVASAQPIGLDPQSQSQTGNPVPETSSFSVPRTNGLMAPQPPPFNPIFDSNTLANLADRLPEGATQDHVTAAAAALRRRETALLCDVYADASRGALPLCESCGGAKEDVLRLLRDLGESSANEKGNGEEKDVLVSAPLCLCSEPGHSRRADDGENQRFSFAALHEQVRPNPAGSQQQP